MSPRLRKAEDVEIFSAMVRVMMRVGPTQLTLAAIAKEAGISAGELRAETDIRSLARTIEVTLGGSFLAWTMYREGAASTWLSEDLDAVLRPHLTGSGRKGR